MENESRSLSVDAAQMTIDPTDYISILTIENLTSLLAFCLLLFMFIGLTDFIKSLQKIGE